ncbi:Cysteine/Histidine-rich C1 domain family protein [Raphanus sativus]|nr:Cysteine/Histidine-rich C1 domain family protein [Raphanus sativus]
MRCVLNPPPQSLLDLKVQDHQLTLLPRLDSFTCNACGLKGDRSPYTCFDCGFMIHQDCIGLPRVININRHDHSVSRTSVLGVVDSVCGICRKKVDWKYGGFLVRGVPAMSFIPNVLPEKMCGTGKNSKDHKEHYLRRIHGNDGILYEEEKKRCNACTHPIGLQSFYGCVHCDFSLHKKCAECPKKKWHVLHNERLTLETNKELRGFNCYACDLMSNGFMYQHGWMKFDVLCGSVCEPFVHPSHPHHPLYYTPTEKEEICKGCNIKEDCALRCIKDDCGFVLGFTCATLPQVMKHITYDHPLSLCYGEKEEASDKFWCDICEKETNPNYWFYYTCKDQHASLHTRCVLGEFAGFMPRSLANFWDKSFEVVLNNSATRPICSPCKSLCIYPIILKVLGTSGTYICSMHCAALLDR